MYEFASGKDTTASSTVNAKKRKQTGDVVDHSEGKDVTGGGILYSNILVYRNIINYIIMYNSSALHSCFLHGPSEATENGTACGLANAT